MITIVGAGLVGSLWALLLKQQGHDVQLFERRPDPRGKDQAAGRSINLVITSRGLFALEQAGLLKKATELAVPVYGRMIHPKAGDLAYQPYGQGGECNLSISRGDLNRFLIDEAEKAGVKIFFAHELEDLDPSSQKLTFKTSTGPREISYDILFGADGSGSRVRKALAHRFSKELQEHTDWLEADYKELSLPVGPQGEAQLRKEALHIWPRGAHMLMALANRDNSFTMTLYLPKTSKNSWSFEKIKSSADVEELFRSEFPDALALMPEYQREFAENPQGVLGTVRASRWVFQDNIALMGDAAHGIVPFFGQGMNSAFEDASCLLALLKEYPGDWPRILNAYEKHQKPNAHAIAEMALENWVEMRDKVGDARFLLRKKLDSALEQKHPGVYKARYGLITYTLTPYALAFEAGLCQTRMLDQILEGVDQWEQIPWDKAEKLLQEQWIPFLKESRLDLRTYPNAL